MPTITHDDVSYVRLLVARPEGPARLGAITWSRTDPSVYLLPPANYPRYRYGRTEALGLGASQINLDGMPFTTDPPKLSLHSTGQAHIRATTPPGSEPTFMGPLRLLRGQHVASITVDSIAALPAYPLAKLRRERKGERDILVVPEPGSQDKDGVSVLIYLNALEARFACDPPPRLRATLTRPGFSYVMHVGVLADFREGPSGGTTGVTVIGGWDPVAQRSRAQVIRGER